MDGEKKEYQTARMVWLDFFKGLLVFVMVLAHCIQFFGDEKKLIQGAVSELANLTTFSGFFFIFGTTGTVAYLKQPVKQACYKIAISFWRYIFAYYVSAFAFSIFVEGSFFLPRTVWNIISFRELKGYSEFLLAFAAMQLIVLVLLPLWNRMKQRHYALLALISILAVLFPFKQNEEPVIGLFVGSEKFYSFPVLPYLIYFIAGMWYFKYAQDYSKRVKWMIAAGMVLLSTPCAIYLFHHQELPQRFPPGLLFIFGAAFVILLYTCLCRKLEQLCVRSGILQRILLPLQIMGENSLLFLLLSNLVIFALKGKAFYKQSVGFVIVIFIIILYLCFFIVKITNKKTKQKAGLNRKAVNDPLIRSFGQ